MSAKIEAYGIAFGSPILMRPNIANAKYFPIILANPRTTVTEIREDVSFQTKQHNGQKKIPVILAGSIDILQTFLKTFPDLSCKVILFEAPCFMMPFDHPSLRWLDCDHQSGGAWQIAKTTPEDMVPLLDALPTLTKKGREFLLSVKRYEVTDRVNEIELFAQNVPQHYKDLLASVNPEASKSPLKVAKDGRKTKEGLRSLLVSSIEIVKPDSLKKDLINLVLDYALEQVGKREYLNRLALLTTDEFLKREFLMLRKWVDSKGGALLRDAFFDYYTNKERRSWGSIIATHKKVLEEDLVILLGYSEERAVLHFTEERLGLYSHLLSDKTPPKRPNHPELVRTKDLL